MRQQGSLVVALACAIVVGGASSLASADPWEQVQSSRSVIKLRGRDAMKTAQALAGAARRAHLDVTVRRGLFGGVKVITRTHGLPWLMATYHETSRKILDQVTSIPVDTVADEPAPSDGPGPKVKLRKVRQQQYRWPAKIIHRFKGPDAKKVVALLEQAAQDSGLIFSSRRNLLTGVYRTKARNPGHAMAPTLSYGGLANQIFDGN